MKQVWKIDFSNISAYGTWTQVRHEWQVRDRCDRWEDRPSALCSSMAKYSLASTSSRSLSSSSSHRVVMEMEPCCSDDTVVTRSCCVRFVSYSCCVVSSIMSRRRDTDPCSRLLASVKQIVVLYTAWNSLIFFSAMYIWKELSLIWR